MRSTIILSCLLTFFVTAALFSAGLAWAFYTERVVRGSLLLEVIDQELGK